MDQSVRLFVTAQLNCLARYLPTRDLGEYLREVWPRLVPGDKGLNVGRGLPTSATRLATCNHFGLVV
jgi:hypothetical protein